MCVVVKKLPKFASKVNETPQMSIQRPPEV